MSMSCQHAVELLPWLINGSLEERERQAVRNHLASCDGCHRELEETFEVWQLLDRHVPSLALAEYAQGLAPSDLDRERIERHLACCPSCRQELEWALSDRVVDPETVRAARAAESSRRRSWGRPLALAASLAAVLASAGLIWSLVGSGFPPPGTEVTVQGSGSSATPSSAPPSVRGEPDRAPETRASRLLIDGFESGGTSTWSCSSPTDRLQEERLPVRAL